MAKKFKKPDIPDYYVVKDTREQNGYFFSKFNKCAGMVTQKLDTGDYTIEGMEDKICVERKASVEEISINLCKQKHAFMNEIERMKEFPHRFLILEFSLDDLIKFPDETRIPADKIKSVRITGKYILRCLMEFQVHDGIHVVFADDKYNAFRYISSLFKRINELYTVGRQK